MHGTVVVMPPVPPGLPGHADAAVFLRGAPGAGKSALALRVIAAGGRLVADDRVILETTETGVLAAPPPVLAGLLEVRGIGIVRVPPVTAPPLVRLVVDLVPSASVPRLPEGMPTTMLSGRAVPSVALSAADPDAVFKIHLALAVVERPETVIR